MDRHVLAILLLSVTTALFGVGIIIPVMPVFAVSLGAGGIGLGMIIAAFSMTRAVLQPLVGGISDRWSRKGFLVAGLCVYTLVGLLLPRADSISGLIGIRVLHGIGSAMIVPVAMACVGDMAPLGREGRYMGMLNIAIFIGIGGGPLFGGFFSDIWGMAGAFYAMAALSCCAMLLVVLRMPPIIREKTYRPPHTIGRALVRMLSRRRTGGILLARMSTMIIMVPTMAFLPLLMHQWFDASGKQVGLVIACRTLVNALLQTPCGRLADRYDKIRLLRMGCLVISCVICLVPFAGSYPALLLLFVILGLGEAIVWPVLGALATQEGRYYGQGTMMGVFSLAMSVGIFLGAMGAGISMDRLGLRWSFINAGIVVLGLTMLAARLIGNDRAGGEGAREPGK
ncbi:MAG: MFS transporter [Desulfobulbaceae bacterium]